MGLKLIPYEVKCHADSAISALQSDTSSYNSTWQKIEEFTKEEVLCGTAWMTMRRHMRIHQIITGTLIRANSSMIRDYETLKNTVGSEILDEDSLRL